MRPLPLRHFPSKIPVDEGSYLSGEVDSLTAGTPESNQSSPLGSAGSAMCVCHRRK